MANNTNAHASRCVRSRHQQHHHCHRPITVTQPAASVGGQRARRHRTSPTTTGIVNRTSQISNCHVGNSVDHQPFSFLNTYISRRILAQQPTTSPYTGMSIRYGWGTRQAVTPTTQTSLCNFQPVHEQATTASNNRLIGNYVHDVMQQNDRWRAASTRSRGTRNTITTTYCTKVDVLGQYFDEGSKFYTVRDNVFSAVGAWSSANYLLRRGEYRQLTPSPTTGPATATPTWSTATGGTCPSTATYRHERQLARLRPVSDRVGQRARPWRAGGRSRAAAVRPLRRRRQQHTRPTAPRRSCGLQEQRGPGVTYTCEQTAHGVRRRIVPGKGQAASNGTAAAIWDCNGQTSQQWNLNANGTVAGVQSGLCLDAKMAARRRTGRE